MNVGYWRQLESRKTSRYCDGKLPWPGEEPKIENWSKLKKSFIKRLELVESKSKLRHYKGFSRCRICNIPNGTAEYTSKGFIWPTGYMHYIVVHDVCPPLKFWEFVVSATISQKALTKAEYVLYVL